MPRLLPRLVRVLTSPRKDWLTSTPTSPLFPKPPPKNTRVKATEMPNFTAKRSKSILLDSVNPVMHPKAYQLQKTKHPSVTNDAYVRRLLSEEGIKQRANPYLRMLASSVRRCVLTSRCFPSDFLLRLSTSQLKKDSGTIVTYLLPDGLEHPKFRAISVGRGSYIILWKDALNELTRRGGHRRIHRFAEAHGLLGDQVMYQLQERVLQELELVFEKYARLQRDSWPDHIVHQLSGHEVEDLTKQSRRALGEDTLAIITFPTDSDIPVDAPLPPMALLLSASATLTTMPMLSPLGEFHDDLLPPHRLPVYNGGRLFPDPSRRNALRSWLEKLSAPAEAIKSKVTNQRGTRDAAKTETAFVIRNPRQLLECGVDMVPSAIALWRIRLWDGEGWHAPQS